MKEIAKTTHPVHVDDIELTATVPQEMITAQQELLTWCEKKIASIKFDVKELFEALSHAKKMKWKISVLARHHAIAEKRLLYYEKIKAAVEHGFYLVPNFPVQLFAIKTKGENPIRMVSTSYWGNKEQSAQQLKINEGEYKNPFPFVDRTQYKDAEGKTISSSEAVSWEDIDFPINMAKPLIMQVTTNAMALKIFDRFGVMPTTRKNDDPVIIGQIVRKQGYREFVVSFMIVWHLNTNVL